jgi:hypothetical protein
VPLSALAISELVGLYGGAPDLTVRFDMSAADSFRLAIPDDLFFDSTYFPLTYGVGLAAGASIHIPEPAAILLALCAWLGLLAVGRRRRRLGQVTS